ncbi:hypothetical protein QQ045_016006 [Rhodiola kirilowii]
MGPEDQLEVNESVPNETEDAELFTSSVNEKEKNQPKDEANVEEKKLTAMNKSSLINFQMNQRTMSHLHQI